MNIQEAIKIIALIKLYQLAKEDKLNLEKLLEKINEPNETFKEIVRQLIEQIEATKNYWEKFNEWRNKNNE